MMGKIDFKHLDANAKYLGYLWFSDATEAVFLNNEFLPEALHSATQNPFVVEGQLMTTDQSLTYQLRHNGVETEVFAINWDAIESNTDQYVTDAPESYLVKGTKGNQRIKFRTVWQAVADEAEMPDFEVLTPLVKAFCGFDS